ncbi:hypothetical protein R69749_07434 [Paraburkholderia domus]|nr:hypothetical protein R69749_07434 [Paraburkholderia domus]
MFKIFSIYMDYYIFISCFGGEMFGMPLQAMR